MPMEIFFLGTASAYPTPIRGVSCIALRNDGDVWLFDCGEGSQIQLMRSELRPGKISRIFITHLHGDHLFGLPGLMCTVSQNFSPENKEPVHLYGPKGLLQYVCTSLNLSCSMLGFQFIVHELEILPEQCTDHGEGFPKVVQAFGSMLSTNVEDGTTNNFSHPNLLYCDLIKPDQHNDWKVHEDEKVSVTAGWLNHTIPSFGFVITEKPVVGKLDAVKLKALGVPPGPLYAKIKAGEKITLPNGDTVEPSEVLGPSRPGRKLVILGDTADSSQVKSQAHAADILIHECTLEDGMETIAKERGHSTAGMAGKFASEIQAKKLILTHFSQRYKPLSLQNQSGDDNDITSVQTLLDQAMATFGYSNVIAAEDLMKITVPALKT